MNQPKPDATQILSQSSEAGHEKIAELLLPMVYQELRGLAAKFLRAERSNHTLQPTALVHEAFLKLVDQKRVNWQGRTHFYAVGAQAMRRILIDHARARARGKRGGDWKRVELSGIDLGREDQTIDTEGFDAILEELAELDPLQAQIVELRFFAGLTVEEVSQYLGVSKRKVEGDWTHAKAWLRSKIGPENLT